MAWKYIQSNGNLSHGGALVATGYSGHGEGKNNPAMQSVRNVGPIPVGMYEIGPMMMHKDGKGPIVMRLTAVGHEAFHRSGFLIHGDNADHTASEGCIILPRAIRQRIAESGDNELEVV